MTDEGKIARLVYNEAVATPTMRAIPRFGASRSFADLFGTQEEQTDYIVGLLFAGLFLFSIYFAWTVVLLLFKCLGPKRVGFLSGSAFLKPSDPTSRTFNRPFLSRLVFLNAALLFIVFSVLFVTQGLTNLRTTVTTLLESARNVDAVMTDLDTLVTDVKMFGASAANASDIFLSRLATGAQDCLLDDNVQEETSVNFGELIAYIGDVLTSFGIAFAPKETEELSNTTEYVQNNAEALDENVGNVDIGDWQSLIVIIPYIIIPSFLMLGVCAAWFEFDLPKLRCLLSWLVLPIFILQVIFSYTFSSAVLIAAAANADFCSGGSTKTPDGTVLNILAKEGYAKDDMAFQIVSWYVGQCAAATEDPFNFILRYEGKVDSIKADIASFSDGLEKAGNTALSELCARDVELLEDLSLVLTNSLEKAAGAAADIIDLMQCSKIVSLYTNPFYDGTCTYSITGVTWAWASFAVVACMGLIMIMLRSTWQLDVYEDSRNMHVVEIDTKINSEDDPDDDEYGGYTGYNAAVENFNDESKDSKKDQEQAGDGGYGQLANNDEQDDNFGGGDEDSFGGGGGGAHSNGLPSPTEPRNSLVNNEQS